MGRNGSGGTGLQLFLCEVEAAWRSVGGEVAETWMGSKHIFKVESSGIAEA